ncbi:MAG: DUF885 domain-containing protein [Haliea sp.]|nr:DUF885 domain-containing protein [Haliea sp.]|tara:strand:+ start:1066 stop:2901 length:1836 start_codon:yes stop_codon:yes gene_type:complete
MSSIVKTYIKRGAALAGCALLVMLAFAAHEWYAKPVFVGNLFSRTFIQYLWNRPEDLTYLGILESVGINGHNALWNDESEAAARRENEFFRDVLATLARYDPEKLSESDRLSAAVFHEFIGAPDVDWRFRHHDYTVNQLDGVHIAIPEFLDSYHRVNSKEDAEHYIARLSAIDVKMAQIMDGLLVREKKGVIPPTFVIDKSIAGMVSFVESPARANVLYTSFERKLEAVDSISPADREMLLSTVETEIKETVYPAYRQYIDYFNALRSKSTDEAGVWKLPDGEAYYNYLLKVHTTTDMTANEIHTLGLAEVARIQKAVLDVFASEGYDSGLGVAALFQALGEESRFIYPDTDEGREQILRDYRSIIKEINAGVAGAFNLRPRAEIVIERLPAFQEETAPGAYYAPPSQDGSRPGVFYANLYDIKATPKYGMRTLAYHEGVPGHHYQSAINVELEDIPASRKAVGFTAYSEGWALYAEQLAWEMGFLTDPYDNLGRLQAELLRAVRLVVDTGIHAKRWTREQALNYLVDNTGWATSDAIVEIERYIVNPGQATAYKVGMMELLSLREEAEAELGEKFDIRDFHEVVLGNGALPLTTIGELVRQYIKRKQAEV